MDSWCGIRFGNDNYNPLYYAENLYLNNELVTDLVIPDTVTEIKQYVFYGLNSLTSVVIPNNVTKIGTSAFGYCTSLTNVEIGSGTTTIGANAFSQCNSLLNIDVDENNTAYKDIDGNLYSKDGRTLIQYAISKTENSFTIPSGVTTIGSYAFSGCPSLTSIVIPDSVTTIGERAFYQCSNLVSITIPSSVTSIGSYAFLYCDKLVEVINNSTNITVVKGSKGNGYIGYYALDVYNCEHDFESKLSNDDGYIVYTDVGDNTLITYEGDEADLVIAYVTYSWGGAAKTLEYAKRKKKTIINLAEKNL